MQVAVLWVATRPLLPPDQPSAPAGPLISPADEQTICAVHLEVPDRLFPPQPTLSAFLALGGGEGPQAGPPGQRWGS